MEDVEKQKIIDESKLQILICRLHTYNYQIDEIEKLHLANLIRREVVKITIAGDYLDWKKADQ